MSNHFQFRYDIIGTSLGQEFVLTHGYVGDSTEPPERTANVMFELLMPLPLGLQSYLCFESLITGHRLYFLSPNRDNRVSFLQPLNLAGLFPDEPISSNICIFLVRNGSGEFSRSMRSRLHIPSVGTSSVLDGVLNDANTQIATNLPTYLSAVQAQRSQLVVENGFVAQQLSFTPAVIAKRRLEPSGVEFRWQPLRNPAFSGRRLGYLRSRSPGHGR